MVTGLYQVRKQSKIKKCAVGALFFFLRSISVYCTYRTCTCAGTAADTLIGIDLKLAITCRDSSYGALSLTGTTVDAGITYYICHNITLLLVSFISEIILHKGSVSTR